MTNNFPEHLDHVEAAIINHLITAGLKGGGRISVHDGEETTLDYGRKVADIQAEVAATDETTLTFYDSNRRTIGRVWLVHGNGIDVIADYSDTTPMADVLARALRYVEAIG